MKGYHIWFLWNRDSLVLHGVPVLYCCMLCISRIMAGSQGRALLHFIPMDQVRDCPPGGIIVQCGLIQWT